jgi:hypothetical protein
MMLGPDISYKCPKCGKLLAAINLQSGNTFGAVYYSDGKRIASMLPDSPYLVRCSGCNEFFWLNNENENGKINVRTQLAIEFDPKKRIEWAKFPNLEDFILALESKIYNDIQQELYIRVRIWWAFNDRVRNKNKIFNSDIEKEIWQDNLNFLLSHYIQEDIENRQEIEQYDAELIIKPVDTEPEDDFMSIFRSGFNRPPQINYDFRIRIAEIFRNLGNFEKCMEYINSIDKGYVDLIDRYKIECKNKNSQVFQFG